MNRRFFLKQLGGVVPLLALGGIPFARLAWGGRDSDARIVAGVERIKKSKEEWRRLLTPAAYDVLFEEDTERQNSSPLNKEKRSGIFLCAACYNPLFSSEAKFDSGTGWPSFFRSIEGHTETKLDFKLILPRTEYHCMRCGGHQGHRFNDGPPPTGQRWCNNGVALLFVPQGTPVPPLRT
ncbi:MAG: peptide-methionine (R)-S-oxide reductase MsrB [Nitrospirae bacterium]|nr:peptide-methionine (R)-S-oxide reductase MsrB [Candidatus Troglogloeales bacterium]